MKIFDALNNSGLILNQGEHATLSEEKRVQPYAGAVYKTAQSFSMPVADVENVDRFRTVLTGNVTSWGGNIGNAGSAANFGASAIVDGCLYTWGSPNNRGRTGGSNIERVGTASDWLQVAGYRNQLGIRSVNGKNYGTLWTWGSSVSQIGSIDDWKQVVVCANSTSTNNTFLAIRANGDVYHWGSNVGISTTLTSGTTASPTLSTIQPGNVVKLVPSGIGAFAITATGQLWASGVNSQRQLGLPATGTNHWTQVGTDTDWDAAWGSHNGSQPITFARKNNGDYYYSGTISTHPRLPFAPTSSATAFTKLTTFSTKSVQDIAAGDTDTYVLYSDGTVYGYGLGGTHILLGRIPAVTTSGLTWGANGLAIWWSRA